MLSFILLMIFSTAIDCASQPENLTKPKFAEPIKLFQPRSLADKLETAFPEQIPAAVIAWLREQNSYSMLEKAIGRQLTQTGHDTIRKEIYTGTLLKPEFIVLTQSGKSTLQETIDSLKSNGLAHNFIINFNGDIYPVTNDGESIQQALTHRPYALGSAGYKINGSREQRDMNSASITISVVGLDTQKTTHEQNSALITLIKYLQQQYSIRPDQVLDYGCIAYPYGRRNPQPNLPWDLLSQQKLATYPQVDHMNRTMFPAKTPEEKVIWISQALSKLGFIGCPATRDKNNADFKSTLQTFQKHAKCDQEDGSVTQETMKKLNSLIIQHEEYNSALKDIEPPALPLTSNDPWLEHMKTGLEKSKSE